MGEIWVSLDMMLWKMKMLGMLDFGDKIDPVLFSILISVVAVKMLGWMMEESSVKLISHVLTSLP